MYSGVYVTTERDEGDERDGIGVIPSIPSIQRRFTTVLRNTLPPLKDSVQCLIDMRDQGLLEGEDADVETGGKNKTKNETKNETNEPGEAPFGTGRRHSLLWTLMSELLGGDTSSGLIPMPTMPVVNFRRYRRNGAAVVRSLVEDRGLAGVWATGGGGVDAPLSQGCLEACRAVMDWSLSTLGPCARSDAVVGMCRGEQGTVGRVGWLDKVGRVDKMCGVGGRVFKGLGLTMCDVSEAVDAFCAWGREAGSGGKVAPTLVGLTADPPIVGQGNVGDEDGKDNERGDMEPEEDPLVAMIRAAHIQEVSRSQSQRRKTQGATAPVAGLTSSSDLYDVASWDHTFCALSTPWVYVMEQAVSMCGSLINWSGLSDGEVGALASLDFGLVDEAALRAFEERIRDVPDGVVAVVEECAAVCRSIIHRDVQADAKLTLLAALQPVLAATASQAEHRLDLPMYDAARKAILSYRVLFPGRSQLVMVSKKHWQALYQVLHDAGVSVFQIMLPLHATYFEERGEGTKGIGDNGGRDGGSRMSTNGIWNDFDCFFLPTDEETVRRARDPHGVFNHFRRIVLLETEPMFVRMVEPSLRSMYDRGVSVCLLRIGLGLAGPGAFRLEPQGRDSDGTGERQGYEGFKQKNDGDKRGVDVFGAFETLGAGFGLPESRPARELDVPPAPSVAPVVPADPQGRGSEKRMNVWEVNDQVARQANTSLGDTSFAKAGAPTITMAMPAELGPGRGMDTMAGVNPGHYNRQNYNTQVIDNLFSDREDSFLHDSFFDRNSAPGETDAVRGHLAQAGWKPFQNHFETSRPYPFDASPYLHQWDQGGLGKAGRPSRPSVPLPSPVSALEHSGSLFHHENVRPFAADLSLPFDEMVDRMGPGSFPATSHFPPPATWPLHAFESTFQDTFQGNPRHPSPRQLYEGNKAYELKLDLGGRSPFSPLDVVHADDPFPEGGGNGTPGGRRDEYGARYGVRHDLCAHSPYTHPRQPISGSHNHVHHPHHAHDSYHEVRTVSPMQLETPPRFWPQPMNQTASFQHIEKLYDQMRAGRPKRRAQLGRGKEKFKKFK